MSISPLIAAINQLAEEKELPKEQVLEIVEAVLAAAYRKEYGKPNQIIKVSLNPEDNAMKVWQIFNVVEEDAEIENPANEIHLSAAKKIDKKTKSGEQIKIPLEAKSDFGRIAAQTAKQVIIQKLREAERNILYAEFKEKEKKIINATVQQIEGSRVIVNLGKINAIIPPNEQIQNERYYIGQRLKVYVCDVEESLRGPRIIVSRSRPEFITGLFAQEVPEIESGTVEIKAIAREPGARTKIGVHSDDENLDPVGSAVGQRGTRVQSVLTELPNEKIDIILYDKDPETYITNALSPARILKMKLDKKNRKAKIWIDEDQLALAIGKSGQNVRLAGKLTGWEIDIIKEGSEHEKKTDNKADTVKETKTRKGSDSAKNKGVKTKEKDLEKGSGKKSNL